MDEQNGLNWMGEQLLNRSLIRLIKKKFIISFMTLNNSTEIVYSYLTNYNWKSIEKVFEFTPTAKDSAKRKKLSYICGLRTRIERERRGEHSTHSDRVTNIG